MALQRDQMAELRETAKIYYNALPREVQEKAEEFFLVMDDNRDGKINLHEFLTFLREEGYPEMMNMSFFKKLDKDGDGTLDFEEVMTLYYIIKSGRPFCLGCTQLIEGLFFTCVQCFDCDGSTFNVCPICFGTGQYTHTHKEFLDNFVLLQAKRKQRSSSSSVSLPIVLAPQQTQSQNSSSSSASLVIVPATQQTQNQRSSSSSASLVNVPATQQTQSQRSSSSSTSLAIVPAPQQTQSQRSSSSFASLAIVSAPQQTQIQRFSSSSAFLPIFLATPHIRRSKWRIALRAFENTIGVGNIAVGLCTLM